MPKVTTRKSWTKKIKPGVSTFSDRPSAIGKEHLKELIDFALGIIPQSQLEHTPIFLMATAGMRLLDPISQSTLLKEICDYAAATPFALSDCGLHIQVIPGETEALYGWIATNYLLGGFDSPKEHEHGQGHHTYGFLDMGGASAQIAFSPNQTESKNHASNLKLLRMRTLSGDPLEYRVFVATWLRFGVNEARARYVDALKESINTAEIKELPDPCMPVGLTLSIDGEITDSITANAKGEPYLKGQGLFGECLRKTYPLLGEYTLCENSPCLLNSKDMPAIDFNVNHFVGVSEYWHTTHGVFDSSQENKPYDFSTYQTQVKQFCSQNWVDIEMGVKSGKWGNKVDQRIAIEVCFKASWLINFLHEGIGIPRKGLEKAQSGYNATKDVSELGKWLGFLHPFEAVNKIDNKEVSWTLGKMVLYAAGQIEPHSTTLDVGFGSNVPAGIPDDFQYAGSTHLIPPSESDNMEDDEILTDAAGDILKTSRPSVSSLALFALVIFIVCYVFRKRERRKCLYNKFEIFIRRGRGPGSIRRAMRGIFSIRKLFGRSSVNYERVLEGGVSASEFDLHDTDCEENEYSDSSESSRVARTSGLATPKLNVLSYSEGAFLDSTSAPLGLGLNGINVSNAMNRSGLVVRTESRERLALSYGAGRKSRTGSPIRGKSPLMMPVDEF